MPASQEWLGLYSAALLELTKAYNYFQVNPTDLTPEATATLAYEQYLTWLSSAGCAGGGCEIPGWDGPIFRRTASGGIEQLSPDGTTWETPTGDYAPPVIPERPEPTEPEQKCGAASNAVYAIKAVFDWMTEWYQEEYDPALETVEWGLAASTAIATTLGLWTAGLGAFLQAAMGAFHAAADIVFADSWTDEFTDILVCTFQDNITIDGGVAHFNYQQILWDLCGFILPVVDDFLQVRWQVWYILQIIGADGLDEAGGLQNVEGDCVTCDTWCVEMTWAQFEAYSPTLYTGYVDGSGNLRTADIGGGNWQIVFWSDIPLAGAVITRFGVEVSADYPTYGEVSIRVDPWAGGTGTMWWNSGIHQLGGAPHLEISPDDAALHTEPATTGACVVVAAIGQTGIISKLHFEGTGTNPFSIGSNC